MCRQSVLPAPLRPARPLPQCRKQPASGTGAAASWLPVLENSEAGSLILALLPTVSGIAIRILMALLIPCLAFGAENLRILIKKGVIFLALTLLSGGAVMAFLLWQQIPAISGNGSIYIEAATYLQLLCWGVIAFGLVWWFVRLVRLLRLSRWTEGELQVQMQQDGRFIFCTRPSIPGTACGNLSAEVR